MMVVVCFKSVQKELKNAVVAHQASTEVPCCAMGVPGRAEQDWALSAAGPSQAAPAPSLRRGVGRPQPGWSRPGLPGEAGPACRPAVEPGAEAAMFGRGRSSRPCLPGSASPLCSSHYCYWEDFPLTPAVCPHLVVTSVLARFGFFSSVSWSCCFIRSVARQAVFGLPGKLFKCQPLLKEDFLLPW